MFSFSDDDVVGVMRELQDELFEAAADANCDPGKLLRLTALATGYCLMGLSELLARNCPDQG